MVLRRCVLIPMIRSVVYRLLIKALSIWVSSGHVGYLRMMDRTYGDCMWTVCELTYSIDTIRRRTFKSTFASFSDSRLIFLVGFKSTLEPIFVSCLECQNNSRCSCVETKRSGHSSNIKNKLRPHTPTTQSRANMLAHVTNIMVRISIGKDTTTANLQHNLLYYDLSRRQ